ncbi:MAG: hypothetical protein K6F15_11060 [Treponema sp.]|nr:hypothetical protein [Treponema sp.]
MKEESGEFWRQKFSEMQKKNMKALGRDRMNMQNVEELVNNFCRLHPTVKNTLKITSNSADWELPLNAELKMRFFIQGQVKGSIMQRAGAGYVKVADAKFFSDPIPEITEFLAEFAGYERELNSWQTEREKLVKVQKLTGEMIKALLKKKFAGQNVLWNLEANNQNFSLTIEKDGKSIIHLITENFVTEINDL